MHRKILLFPFYCLLFLIVSFSGCSSKRSISVPAKPGESITSDVIYGNNKDWKGNEQSLKMDIYMPVKAATGKKYPLVIFMHGGGFLTGNKKSENEKCSILADSGFVVANLNYRVGWDKGDKQCEGNVEELQEAGYRGVQDANAALRFLVSRADKYAIDTGWIFTAGSSAGAIASLCMVYLNDANIKNYYPQAASKLGSLANTDNNLTNTFSIKGICSISGALPDSALINRSTAIPTIFFHGENDKTVPVNIGHYASCSSYPAIYGSECLYRCLQQFQVPTVAHILPFTGHGSDEGNVFSDEFKMRNAASFFHSIIKKEPIQSGLFMGEAN